MGEEDKPLKFQRRPDARPDEMLDAALELFAAHGYANTRIIDVAKRAGVSKGSIYRYFSSKEALLEALVRRALTPLAVDSLEAFKDIQGDPREMISFILRGAAFQLDHEKALLLPRVVLREALTVPSIAKMYREEVLNRALGFITVLVQRGVDDGHFRSVDPEFTARSVVGPLMAHVLLSEVFGVVPEGGLEFERFIENHLSILFDGLSTLEVET